MSEPAKATQALREIRELLLVNGCHDEWLETQIKKIIQDALPEAENEI